jgi:hypothetical protein
MLTAALCFLALALSEPARPEGGSLALGAVTGANAVADFVYTCDVAGNRLSKAQTDHTKACTALT